MRHTSIIHQWRHHLGLALLAPRCLVCNAPIGPAHELCHACFQELPFLIRQCRHCALPLPEHTIDNCCPDCRRCPRFDHAFSGFDYQLPVARMITQLKYQQRLYMARPLARLLAHQARALAWPAPDQLIPVPLHPRAFRRRGFNQSGRIADMLGNILGWTVDRRAFRRIRDTPNQRALDAIERADNMRHAFATRHDLSGAHLVLLDDVMTTGHTLQALAQCARQAGARRIDVVSVARA